MPLMRRLSRHPLASLCVNPLSGYTWRSYEVFWRNQDSGCDGIVVGQLAERLRCGPGARLLRRRSGDGRSARAARGSRRGRPDTGLRLVPRLLELEWRRPCLGGRPLGRGAVRLQLGAARLGAFWWRLAYGAGTLGAPLRQMARSANQLAQRFFGERLNHQGIESGGGSVRVIFRRAIARGSHQANVSKRFLGAAGARYRKSVHSAGQSQIA